MTVRDSWRLWSGVYTILMRRDCRLVNSYMALALSVLTDDQLRKYKIQSEDIDMLSYCTMTNQRRHCKDSYGQGGVLVWAITGYESRRFRGVHVNSLLNWYGRGIVSSLEIFFKYINPRGRDHNKLYNEPLFVVPPLNGKKTSMTWRIVDS